MRIAGDMFYLVKQILTCPATTDPLHLGDIFFYPKGHGRLFGQKEDPEDKPSIMPAAA